MHILVAVLTNEKINEINKEEYEKLLKSERETVDIITSRDADFQEYDRRWKENKQTRNKLFEQMILIVDNKIKDKYYCNNQETEDRDYFSYDSFKICGNWTDVLDHFGYKPIKDFGDLDIITNNFVGYVDLDNIYHDLDCMHISESYREAYQKRSIERFRKYLEDNPEMYIIPVDFHI